MQLADVTSMLSRSASFLVVFVAASSGACGGDDSNVSSATDAGGSGDVSANDSGSMSDGAASDARASDAATDAPVADPPGVFLAVGYGGRRVRSVDDGKTWQDDQSLEANGGDDDKLLRTVLWGNGTFVALGWRSMTSADGKTWVDHGTTIGQWIGSALWDGAQYVAMGGYGLRATSADAITWDQHSIDTVASHPLYGIAFGGGRYAAVNDDGHRSTSADGKTWTYATGEDATTSTDVAFGNGVFVALGTTSTVRSQDGGKTYSAGGALSSPCAGLVFAKGQFLALADGHTFTSPDGASWTEHASPNAHQGAIAYGHGTFVMMNGNERFTSSDGVAWTSVANDKDNALVAIAFGPQ